MLAFRLWEPKKLLWAAGICMVLMLARENRDLYLEKSVISKGEAIEKMDTTVTKLNPKQKAQLEALHELRESSSKAAKVKRMERANKIMTGSYGEIYEFRTNSYLDTIIHYTYFLSGKYWNSCFWEWHFLRWGFWPVRNP